ITEDSWISVDACAELLELVEARFGDGSYAFIRAVFATTAPSFPTIRGELARRMSLRALSERAPVVYAKEWNFGRLEVETTARIAKNEVAWSGGVLHMAKMMVGIITAKSAYSSGGPPPATPSRTARTRHSVAFSKID